MGNLQIWQKNFPVYQVLKHLNSFEIYFFIMRFISKIKNNTSRGKISICEFYSKNIEGNWTYLAEKNLKITATFSLS